MPELAPAWVGLAELCLRGNRLAEVEAILTRLEADSPSPEVPLLRARLYLQRRDFPAARQLLEGLIAQTPQAPEPRRLLTYVLLQEDRDPPAAERALRDLLAVAPTDSEARHNLSLLLRRQGQTLSA